MNLKRDFGTIPTVLGILGLIYAAIGIVQNSEGYKMLIVFALPGIVFFFTGMGLVRSTISRLNNKISYCKQYGVKYLKQMKHYIIINLSKMQANDHLCNSIFSSMPRQDRLSLHLYWLMHAQTCYSPYKHPRV